ncbi:pyrroline-5-carboxylate reductase [Fodinicurvata sp. EGI_FJ10296]|uniref:pyrroline-5-carboxylate reductase n=1 Tax=Fodinicurvata sp. EGI_FJ10296 TaxID=3231908 RepID=UPI0034511BAC
MSKGILLVGCGKMGGALLRGWLADPAFGDVTVVDPVAADLPRDDRLTVVSDFGGVRDPASAALVVLAVKPQVMADVLPAYAGLATAERVFLSVAAGKSIDFFRRILGAEARVVRAMPNIPVALGQGASGLFAGPGVDDAQIALCDRAMRAAGSVEWVGDEKLIDAVTGVSGSGPAYFFYMVECLAAAGRKQGLSPEVADRLAQRTLWGAASMVEQGDETPSVLRKNVSSPGGTTEAALGVLMKDGGLESLMDEAVAAAAARGRELSD